ncbi:MAG: hypothetical protein HRT88_07050 [Lentisphaeraceae bacterium]|nr:hypothetical protein [Lentisphaeraceae bacterium]
MALKSHHDIALASISCFTDDGTLDMEEVNFLIGLALRDDVVDDGEKRVLGDIFSRVSKGDVKAQVWQRILDIKQKHDIA